MFKAGKSVWILNKFPHFTFCIWVPASEKIKINKCKDTAKLKTFWDRSLQSGVI